MTRAAAHKRKRFLARLTAFTAVGTLTVGCGATVEHDPTAGPATTVQRCGEPIEYHKPQRAVVYEGGSADKMFSLGLTERVHGYVVPPANPPVSESPWASGYRKTKYLGDSLLNRELVVNADADFVVAGWQSGFSNQRGITPEDLDRLGIQSFMHTESCFDYPQAPEKTPPFKALYTDMHRLGKIFDVEQRANAVVSDMKDRVNIVRKKAPKGERTPIFVYDSGTDQPTTAGSQVPPTDMIRFAGGRNIFEDLDERWAQTSWESVVQAQPEAIMVVDYGDKPAKEKIRFLKRSPITRNIPAVRNHQFFVLNYNEAISSPRNIDGLEKFAAYLRELPSTD